MFKYIKMKVTNEQYKEVQRIAFEKGVYWDYKDKVKKDNMLYIKGDRLSWGGNERTSEYDEVNADDFIREHSQFPVYRIQKDGLFVVQFTDINMGNVVWISDNISGEGWADDSRWVRFYDDFWKYISEEEVLSLILPNKTGEKTEPEYESDIPKGTIVKATRKSISEKQQDYTWQGNYCGKFDNHYLMDFNGTSYKIADKIEVIPTLTKKEAKQKISELFSQPKKCYT